MPANTPEEIRLGINESTTIKLSGLPTAGYEWSFTISNGKECVTIAKDFGIAARIANKNMGGNTEEIFTIAAKKKGTAIIHFTQQRSWEKNTAPVNEKIVKIIIE